MAGGGRSANAKRSSLNWSTNPPRLICERSRSSSIFSNRWKLARQRDPVRSGTPTISTKPIGPSSSGILANTCRGEKMKDNTVLLEAMLRHDFPSFVAKTFSTLCPGEIYLDNWHLECLTWRLSQTAERKRVRLIINLPPRSLKSIVASVALPAWLLGQNPSRRIIEVSYSDELARKHARDTRTILEAPWYRRAFPATRVSPRKNTETEFTTTRQGFRLATSIGGTLTGRGGDVIIIDDPIKPGDAESEAERRRVNEWYDKTLYSRLDDKEAGAIILVMQRLHEDDLTGHLIEKGEFEVLSLSAIATE